MFQIFLLIATNVLLIEVGILSWGCELKFQYSFGRVDLAVLRKVYVTQRQNIWAEPW